MKQFLMSGAAVVLGLVITLDAQAKGGHGSSHRSGSRGSSQGNRVINTGGNTKNSFVQQSNGQTISKKFILNKKFDLHKHGKKGLRWTNQWWCSRFGRYCYFCPDDSCWYFYEAGSETFVPYADSDQAYTSDDGDE